MLNPTTFRVFLALAVALVCSAGSVKGGFFPDTDRVLQVSADPFTNSTSQHRTEVGPDSFAYGSTIVMVAQQGRFYDGGASGIGWATSTDSGRTWRHGTLPKITTLQNPPGVWDRVTNPSVAYDATHRVWLAASVPLMATTGQIPLVSSSKDGLRWSDPVEVAQNFGDTMVKTWITCDNSKYSQYAGHCYVEYDDYSSSAGLMWMTTSTDGGQTWSTPYGLDVVDAFAVGAIPVVQANGNVVAPFEGAGIQEFGSSDGGQTWNFGPDIYDRWFSHYEGDLFNLNLLSATVDGAGFVYVVWPDCSFRPECDANDIIMSTSHDGQNFSEPGPIPINPPGGLEDDFLPGIAADPRTSGAGAHLALTYYFFPNTNCDVNTCELKADFITSRDGGRTWSRPKTLTPPMRLKWLANTNEGYMVGDYMSTAWIDGVAYGSFVVANEPKRLFNEFLATTKGGLKPDEFVGVPAARSWHRNYPQILRPRVAPI